MTCRFIVNTVDPLYELPNLIMVENLYTSACKYIGLHASVHRALTECISELHNYCDASVHAYGVKYML